MATVKAENKILQRATLTLCALHSKGCHLIVILSKKRAFSYLRLRIFGNPEDNGDASKMAGQFASFSRCKGQFMKAAQRKRLELRSADSDHFTLKRRSPHRLPNNTGFFTTVTQFRYCITLLFCFWRDS